MRFKLTFLCLFAVISYSSCRPEFDYFMTTRGDKLYDGERPFRFISFNIPNLHYIEDNLEFGTQIPFRFPDEYEIRDALTSIQQMGGTVVRIYTLSVKKPDDPPDMPRHIIGPGEFNEEAFIALDKCLQIANELGIRLIIPFVDNWSWWGGRAEYASFRGKHKDQFWTDPQIISDFKRTIEFTIERTNTFTGVIYKNDKAILAWETGNELQSPMPWTVDITAYIKSLDQNHLVIDGFHSSTIRDASLSESNIDVVTTHHYQKDPQQIVELIQANVKKSTGIKPYFIGEFGFINTAGIRKVLDTVINSECSGALLWSLRSHNRDGGFYWHSEPYGGNLFKSYHWPGFSSNEAFDEAGCLALMREKAFAVRGLRASPYDLKAPRLLPIKDVSEIRWQGSAGASRYIIQRAEHSKGPWKTPANDISDAAVQYRPLFNDTTVTIGETYWYRVTAQNEWGVSEPSNAVRAAVVQHHSLVDECRNWDLTYRISGAPIIKQDEARKAREDAHRFRGDQGDVVYYKCEHEINSFKLFAFFPEQPAVVNISISKNGKTFSRISADSLVYPGGEAEYDYHIPVMFYGEVPEGYTFFRIDFLVETEISRIEIIYGREHTN